MTVLLILTSLDDGTRFTGPHPVPGGGRILQALRLGGAGK